MRLDSLSKHFEAMGARVKFTPLETRRRFAGNRVSTFTIDVRRDQRGAFFEIALTDRAPELEVLQARPKERHLLLFASSGERFLCGHDERHWFVSGIDSAVSTVPAAKQALMPEPVREQAGDYKPSIVDNRRNPVFKRQGEWFFVPSERDLARETIHRNEPLQRNVRSKPHICEELVRKGGDTVYIVSGRMYTESEYRRLARFDEEFRRRRVQTRIANPEVYVRGYVRHPDHATIVLEGWHRVYINRERVDNSKIAYLD
jgi:hypothetical protein